MGQVPSLRLDGRCALVTGAFRGLGRHFAETMARAGAALALCGRDLEAGRGLADAMRAGGARAVALPMDVRDPGSVGAAVGEAARALGGLHVVVNNAGVAVSGPAMDASESDWSDVVDVDLSGAWRVAQAAGRHMRDHGGGSIVNVASILGLRVAAQVPAYAAAKAGLIQLTKALALEWARHGIRVNALAPGYIETGLNRAFFASDAGQAMLRRIPQRRLGRPEDLDAPLLLLASEASAYMTGAVLVVDGGHAVSSL